MKILCFTLLILFAGINSVAQKKVDLRLHLKKDNTYYHSLDGNSTITEMIEGKQIDINVGLGASVSYEILDLSDTIYRTNVRYKSVSMKMKVQGNSIEFTSQVKDKTDKMSLLLSKFIDVPFSVEISKRGELTKVGNIDSAFTGIINSVPGLTDDQKQAMIAKLLKAYGEEAFKSNFNMMTAIFPSKKVRLGDKWVVTTALEPIQVINVVTTYQLVNVDKDYWQIRGESTLESLDKDTYVPMDDMMVRHDLSGTMITILKLSKATGWIVEGTIKQDIKGRMDIKPSEQIPEGITVPMTYVNEIKVSGN